MKVATARELVKTYLAHIAQRLDLQTLTHIELTLPLAHKLGINSYQVFTCNFLQDPGSLLAFLFVYLQEPDRIIAHKLFNLVNDLSWYFTKQQVEIPPAIIPVLIYDGDQDFEPQTLKQIYSIPERAPEFYFEYIDLKNKSNMVI
jgi:hypothetical protein